MYTNSSFTFSSGNDAGSNVELTANHTGRLQEIVEFSFLTQQGSRAARQHFQHSIRR